MRSTVILSLAIAALATTALAQPTAIQDRGAAPSPARDGDPAYRRFERDLAADLEGRKQALAATGELADVLAVTPYPEHWKAGAAAWADHRAACSARYRTYDPSTDAYYARPGVKQRCRLAVPPADKTPY